MLPVFALFRPPALALVFALFPAFPPAFGVEGRPTFLSGDFCIPPLIDCLEEGDEPAEGVCLVEGDDCLVDGEDCLVEGDDGLDMEEEPPLDCEALGDGLDIEDPPPPRDAPPPPPRAPPLAIRCAVRISELWINRAQTAKNSHILLLNIVVFIRFIFSFNKK
jgi:hypothetical protein